MILRLESAGIQQTNAIGRAIANKLAPGACIALSGGLGAGKTALSRAICKALGAPMDLFQSPTFTIVNEYPSRLGTIRHADWYRLHSREELDAIGFGDWAPNQGVTLIEWADRIPGAIPGDALHISILHGEGKRRILTLEGGESWAAVMDMLKKRPGGGSRRSSDAR
ncbi:MAG: tRNA threonylcarbamoyladenosine biosynthesis protein TsaE [Myxococcota bacterium]|nr:tRNA threonylcarbamoyladenosine biosynthesis protein TsaE [Myxococcota bacterium]